MTKIAYMEVEKGRLVPCIFPPELSSHIGDQCVVDVDRILEFGPVRRLSDEEGNLPADRKFGKVLRRATLQDHAKAKENELMGRMASNTISDKIEKKKLLLRLVNVHFSFDRAILRITFTCEDRVEYGTLIQELTSELKTRIEMYQIGVRDEAGMIGGMGPCGRSMCCCKWLHRFDSINVRMAKAQRVSLNPSAISGMCGRLKCCLKYEYDTYQQLGRDLPHDGASVTGPNGRGFVVDKDVLRQTVKVRLEDKRVVEYGLNEVQMDRHQPGKHRSVDDEDPGAEWTESESAGKT